MERMTKGRPAALDTHYSCLKDGKQKLTSNPSNGLEILWPFWRQQIHQSRVEDSAFPTYPLKGGETKGVKTPHFTLQILALLLWNFWELWLGTSGWKSLHQKCILSPAQKSLTRIPAWAQLSTLFCWLMCHRLSQKGLQYRLNSLWQRSS